MTNANVGHKRSRMSLTGQKQMNPKFPDTGHTIALFYWRTRCSIELMLREIPDVLQIDGEPRRRWFQSIAIDLTVWYDAQDRPTGFQLCYDRGKPQAERALTWNAPASYRHIPVDDGEGRPFRQKGTPILGSGRAWI